MANGRTKIKKGEQITTFLFKILIFICLFCCSLSYLTSNANGGILDLVANLLEDKCYKEVVDFDDHLDDLSQDWLNKSLNKVIEGKSI